MAMQGKPLSLTVILFAIFWDPCEIYAMDRPSNLTVSDLRYNAMLVYFDGVPGAVFYNVRLQAKYNSSVLYEISTSQTSAGFSGIASNTLYEVKVDADGSKNHSVVFARTPPNGVHVVISKPLPQIFTVFLEAITGASEWEIEVHNMPDNETQAFRTLDGTYYARIIRNLRPNTQYRVRARVSTLNGIVFDKHSSPFGKSEEVTTAMKSLFGRVEVREPYLAAYHNKSSYEYSQARGRIKKWLEEGSRAANYSFIHEIIILDNENLTNNFVWHIEIVLTNRTIRGIETDLYFDNENLLDIRVIQKVNDGSELVLFNYVTEDEWESTYAPYPTGNFDERLLLFDSEEGGREEASFPGTNFVANFGTRTMLLNSEGVYSTSASPMSVMNFKRNTFCAISQKNTYRTKNVADGLLYYSREYGSFHSASTEQDTFLHSGGAFLIPNDTVVTGTSINGGTGTLLTFPRFDKAVTYELTLNYTSTASAVLDESKLDGSDYFQVEMRGVELDAENMTGTMTVATRNHNGVILMSNTHRFNITRESRCDKLASLVNGGVQCTDGNKLGSSCEFHCSDNFVLFGSKHTKCVAFGHEGKARWSNQPPTCFGSSQPNQCSSKMRTCVSTREGTLECSCEGMPNSKGLKVKTKGLKVTTIKIGKKP